MGHFVQRLLQWWRARDPQQQYIAGATDLADLEHRLRALERATQPSLASNWQRAVED